MAGEGKARKNGMTREEFVRRAREVHGDAYGYDMVEYRGTKAKVEILCRRCGKPFFQAPEKHLRGSGCPAPACKAERTRRTNLLQYGVERPLQDPGIRARAEATTMARYGVANGMQSPEVRERFTRSRKAGTVRAPAEGGDPWSALGSLLEERFGPGGAARDAFAPGCGLSFDFYVSSRNLYVDLLPGPGIPPRKDAALTGLNYVAFRSPELLDAKVWAALGCPDGKDGEAPWSWVPDREILGMAPPERLTGTPSNLSAAAKAYQFDEFYREELALWQENPMYKGLPLRVWLYANRLRYLGKGPLELSDLELMRGFTISGVHRGHTVYDTGLMDQVVKAYGVGSIYDPCAGWGERALYCRFHGIPYFGVDVNPGLEPGYARMAEDYGFADQALVIGDSASWPLHGKVQAVLTCPPYGDTEIYSPAGAENLPRDAFLAWWRRVVDNAMFLSPELFFFQVNRKYRDPMLAAVEEAGFRLDGEFFPAARRSSHFTRKRGGVDLKRERESMLALKRI